MTDTCDPLDRLVWHSLTSCHERFAEGGDRARCFPAPISPFAASRDDSRGSLQSLAHLVAGQPDRQFLLMQADRIYVPEEVRVHETDTGVQMVFAGDVPRPAMVDIIALLRDRDVAAMVDLATLTEPGPFFNRTHELGEFWGIWKDGRLAAMAGERLKIPGMSEISGVCTHPDFRGQGLATTLIEHVAARMIERGERPFLHTYANNTGAIRIYEHLGFQHRCRVNLEVIQHAGAAACS